MQYDAYHRYQFEVTGEPREILLAHLGELPFNGFEETEDSLVAYLAEADHDATFAAALADILPDGLVWDSTLIPAENWNEQWESAFQPVQVGHFVGVRAEFHPPFDAVRFDLLIHPRMAFGTGHHATTYQVMERMGELDFVGKTVFDYGCGTGILAILAELLGAETMDAVDIEDAATENTLVNMEANRASKIKVYTGDLSAVPSATYDIILANINRNVILASLAALYDRTSAGGDLLVSGILLQDAELVEQTATACGWIKVLFRDREGWMMMHFRK